MKGILVLAAIGVAGGLGYKRWFGDDPEGRARRQRVRRELLQARDTFLQRRSEALTAPETKSLPPGPRTLATVQTQAALVGARAATEPWTTQVKSRWQVAVEEGRRASEATESEMRRKYLEKTGRLN